MKWRFFLLYVFLALWGLVLRAQSKRCAEACVQTRRDDGSRPWLMVALVRRKRCSHCIERSGAIHLGWFEGI
jgi:hypothetical protein